MATKKKTFQMNNEQKMKYAELFTSALDAMEDAQWQKPWVAPKHGAPMNYKYKRAYRGMNNFLLTLLCVVEGWEAPLFLTFKQLTEMGLSLRPKMKDGMVVIKDNGMPAFEQSFPVVKMLPNFYKDGKRLTPQEYDELTEEEQDECRRFFSMKAFPEFNLSQTDFADKHPDKWEKLTAVPPHEYKTGERDAVLEKMIMQGEWRCPIMFGGHSAHYDTQADHIRLPMRAKFLGDDLFYAIAIHEMAHSTAKELGRNVENGFGNEKYAKEEFVAELTSACVCSMLGIGKLLDEQHIAYVQNWREALRDTKSDFISQVIDHVQKATNYILRRYEQIDRQMNPMALPMAA